MLATLAFSSLTESAMMVAVDVDREKGPRWVSLSSKGGIVSKSVPRLVEERCRPPRRCFLTPEEDKQSMTDSERGEQPILTFRQVPRHYDGVDGSSRSTG
jgi:hypothetical protein